MYLDSTDIQTTCLFVKLSHWCLRPYVVENKVGLMAYCLKLLSIIKQLHLVFNIVKLILTSKDYPY